MYLTPDNTVEFVFTAQACKISYESLIPPPTFPQGFKVNVKQQQTVYKNISTIAACVALCYDYRFVSTFKNPFEVCLSFQTFLCIDFGFLI